MNTSTHPALLPEPTATGPDELLTNSQLGNLTLAWGDYLTNQYPVGRITQQQFLDDMAAMIPKALGWDEQAGVGRSTFEEMES